ncbi:MAG: hypothetical protein WCA63_01445 [Gallionella sp.]
MNSVHLVIPGLFLPRDFAAEVCAGLSVPALQKLLGRGHSEMLEPVPMEDLLCELFDIPSQGNAPIAPISAAFDGLAAGCWLRADPVHLNLQRDQLLLAGVHASSEEAAALCASLNDHFAEQGMEFFTPHPQRWYVRLNALPLMRTTPLSHVIGGDVRRVLPTGEESARWHQLFNEIQMLLYTHPLNEAREARGESIINSVWFWGGGCGKNASPQQNYDIVSSDDVLAEMFAAAEDAPFSAWASQWRAEDCSGNQLLVWTGLRAALQRGDLAAWRPALQNFESSYAQPLWQALRSGKISQLQLDILGGDSMRRVRLTRGDTWACWRRIRRLAEYSLT